MSEPGTGEGAPLPDRIEQTRASEPSTPEQAWEILKTIGQLTDLKGKNYGGPSGSNSFEDDLDAVPPSIAAHFPKPDTDSKSVEQTFHLAHMLGRNKGVVGRATFEQFEHPDRYQTYATHIFYNVITDDGQTYRLERHVTNTEHGPRMARKDREKSPAQKLSELTDLTARAEAVRPMEKAMGLLTVNGQEADEIIDLLSKKFERSRK